MLWNASTINYQINYRLYSSTIYRYLLRLTGITLKPYTIRLWILCQPITDLGLLALTDAPRAADASSVFFNHDVWTLLSLSLNNDYVWETVPADQQFPSSAISVRIIDYMNHCS